MLQKKAVRINCNVSYLHQSNVLFLELHVLKVFDLIELKTSVIMYNAHKKCLLRPKNIFISLKSCIKIKFIRSIRYCWYNSV